MAYVLTILVVTVFFIAYMILKKNPKEVYFPILTNAEYEEKSKLLVFDFQSPDKGSEIEDKKYKSHIKWLLFKLKNKKYKGIFSTFCEDRQIADRICKIDFSALCDNPSVNGKPRAVELARFCLASTGWIFVEDRFKTLANEHNRLKTLTFAEITTMKEAFLYVILEKIYFVLENLNTVAKAMNLAKKYVKDNGTACENKKYKSFSKSRLFLELCMLESNYQKKDKESLDGVIDGLYMTYSRLCDSAESVLNFDFSRYYTPLEIYDKFDCFENATENQKFGFLSLASSLSEKENLDEFMYSIRVEKYMQSASAGHSKVKKVDFFDKSICILSHKKDIAMLGAALSSDFFMRVFFDKKSTKENKSILRIIDFENSFEPIYKFDNLNFGISTLGDVLRISPHLPDNIDSADVVFSNNGIKHTMHIKRGEDTKIYLGNTRIEGTKYIRLANKPLDVTVIVKK